MQEDFREKQRRNIASSRMIKDITMSLIIIGVALLLFFAPKLNLLKNVSNGFRISMGVLFSIYGLFRLYRGIKGDY